jgi:hypothetical protein
MLVLPGRSGREVTFRQFREQIQQTHITVGFRVSVLTLTLSLFLSFRIFLPTHYRRRWLLLHLTNSFRRTTLGRTPLNEGSARPIGLYLNTHNIHKRQKYIHPAEFEPVFPVTERLQTHALDRAATGIGDLYTMSPILLQKRCTQNVASVKSVRVQIASAFEFIRIQILLVFLNFIFLLLFLFFALAVSITRGN